MEQKLQELLQEIIQRAKEVYNQLGEADICNCTKYLKTKNGYMLEVNADHCYLHYIEENILYKKLYKNFYYSLKYNSGFLYINRKPYFINVPSSERDLKKFCEENPKDFDAAILAIKDELSELSLTEPIFISVASKYLENERMYLLSVPVNSELNTNTVEKTLLISKEITSDKIRYIGAKLNYRCVNNEEYEEIGVYIFNNRLKVIAENKNGQTCELKAVFIENKLHEFTFLSNDLHVIISNNSCKMYKKSEKNPKEHECLQIFLDDKSINSILLHPEIKGLIKMVLTRINTEMPNFSQLVDDNFSMLQKLIDKEYTTSQKAEELIEYGIPNKQFDWRKIKDRIDEITSRNISSNPKLLMLEKIRDMIKDSNYNGSVKEEIFQYIDKCEKNIVSVKAKKKKKKKIIN